MVLDRPRLDAVASKLDHGANSACNLEESRGENPSSIAGAVHACAWAAVKMVGLERFRGGFGEVEVAVRQEIAADPQLTARSRFHFLAALVQNVCVLRSSGGLTGQAEADSSVSLSISPMSPQAISCVSASRCSS